MIFWEQLLKTSLLGTERENIDVQNIPLPIDMIAKQILETEIPKEEKLLKISSLVMNFRKAGQQNYEISKLDYTICETENLTYASPKAHQILNVLLSEDHKNITQFLSLINFWIEKCIAKSQIIQAETLILLFENCDKFDLKADKIAQISGKKGLWLAQKHPKWKDIFVDENPEQIWKTGNPKQRQKLLEHLRSKNPKLATTLLDSSWKSESAANKQEFLKFWQNNLSENDQELLEKASQDRSEKVRFMAIDYLKKLPNSSVSQKITEIVLANFVIENKDGQTQLSRKKMTWDKDLEKLNFVEPKKHDHIFYELLACCHLEKLAKSLKIEVEILIDALKKDKLALESIFSAINLHQNTELARLLLNKFSLINAEIFAILPYQEVEKYYIDLLPKDDQVQKYFSEHLKNMPIFVLSPKTSKIAMIALEKARLYHIEQVLYFHADSVLEAYQRFEENPKSGVYNQKYHLDQIQRNIEIRDKIFEAFA